MESVVIKVSSPVDGICARCDQKVSSDFLEVIVNRGHYFEDKSRDVRQPAASKPKIVNVRTQIIDLTFTDGGPVCPQHFNNSPNPVLKLRI